MSSRDMIGKQSAAHQKMRIKSNTAAQRTAAVLSTETQFITSDLSLFSQP